MTKLWIDCLIRDRIKGTVYVPESAYIDLNSGWMHVRVDRTKSFMFHKDNPTVEYIDLP